jgi:hypothetical protein
MTKWFIRGSSRTRRRSDRSRERRSSERAEWQPGPHPRSRYFAAGRIAVGAVGKAPLRPS